MGFGGGMKEGEQCMLLVMARLTMGFPSGSNGKESACNMGDLSSIPGLGRFLGEGKGYPLQYSDLYSPWKSWTRLSNFH